MSSRKKYSTRLSTKVEEKPKRKVEKVIIISSSDDESEEDIFTKKESDSHSTPPKQRKITNENSSPSTLIKGLTLATPDKSDRRKKLFEDSPKGSKIVNARKALHSSVPTEMPGREKELDQLRHFIHSHLEHQTSGSLYVSGPPGTGKTASLNIILQEDNIRSQLTEVYINCTGIKSANAIYSKIAKELGIKVSGKGEKDCLSSLNSFFERKHKMVLLVLDEIDQLDNKNQTILYTIFEWPSNKTSKVILIGIANALDLTDRILPRLQARCELKPELMHFPPYTKQQIIEIFTLRLKEANVLDVFSPVALQLLAGKVAAVSGDVRRALDIGRRVIELIDRKEHTLKPIENMAMELVEEKSVNLQHVVKVLDNVYCTTQNINENGNDSFPLQQKIIICTLLLLMKKLKNNDITVGKLHQVYKKVCTKMNLFAVDQAEFVGLCSLIETRGIIKVSGKKEPRMHKVTLEWDEEEVNAALSDKQLISQILHDDSVLSK